jgi:SPP1 family predicted phage head-tail adaptor
MPVTVGQLDKRIRLKVPLPSRTVTGDKTTAYLALPELWASVTAPNKRRTLEVAPELVNTMTVHVRYSSATKDVLNTWKVMYEGKQYNILTANPDKKKEFIEIIIKAGE